MDGSGGTHLRHAAGTARRIITHDLHHQAPARQPGFGIRPRRHDGRGIRARCDPGGRAGQTAFNDRDGTTLTAKIINPTAPVTGPIDATGYDIAVYFGPGHSGTVTADISGAKYYGVVADGAKSM